MAKNINVAKKVSILTAMSLWWYSRDFRLLMAGLPALVFGLAGLSLCAIAAGVSRQELEVRYVEEAKNANKAGNFKRAMTCYDRLAYRSKERPDVVYGRAQAALKNNDFVEGMELMEQLRGATSYAPGMMFWARFYQDRKSPSADDLKEAEKYLLFALQGTGLDDPSLELSPAEAHGRLGRIYLGRGDLDRAAEQLRIAVRNRDLDRLPLAMVLEKKKDFDQSKQEAQKLEKILKGKVEADPNNLFMRLRYAEVLLFLKDFQGAVNVLKAGQSLETNAGNRELYYEPLGLIYTDWLDYLEQKKESFPVKMARMEEGLADSPADRHLLKKLYSWARKDGDEGKAALQTLLLNRQSPMIEMALGMIAIEKGDIAKGRQKLKDAQSIALPVGSPAYLEITNNLAMALTEKPNPDLTEALRLIDKEVIQRGTATQNPYYIGTRGHIYCLQENWDKAFPDLKAALAAQPNNIQHHLDLATVYSRRAEPDLEMAVKHRERARVLTALRCFGMDH